MYLRSAPISYPLIALTQMCNYLVAAKLTNVGPSELAGLANTAIGHSQGIASAVVVAWSDNDADFQTKAVQMIRFMFWHGARVQQVYAAKVALALDKESQPNKGSKSSGIEPPVTPM